MICREETKPFILIKTQNKERYVLSVKRKASGFGASHKNVMICFGTACTKAFDKQFFLKLFC